MTTPTSGFAPLAFQAAGAPSGFASTIDPNQLAQILLGAQTGNGAGAAPGQIGGPGGLSPGRSSTIDIASHVASAIPGVGTAIGGVLGLGNALNGVSAQQQQFDMLGLGTPSIGDRMAAATGINSLGGDDVAGIGGYGRAGVGGFEGLENLADPGVQGPGRAAASAQAQAYGAAISAGAPRDAAIAAGIAAAARSMEMNAPQPNTPTPESLGAALNDSNYGGGFGGGFGSHDPNDVSGASPSDNSHEGDGDGGHGGGNEASGWRHGGRIPGYASGGTATGGTGVNWLDSLLSSLRPMPASGVSVPVGNRVQVPVAAAPSPYLLDQTQPGSAAMRASSYPSRFSHAAARVPAVIPGDTGGRYASAPDIRGLGAMPAGVADRGPVVGQVEPFALARGAVLPSDPGRRYAASDGIGGIGMPSTGTSDRGPNIGQVDPVAMATARYLGLADPSIAARSATADSTVGLNTPGARTWGGVPVAVARPGTTSGRNQVDLGFIAMPQRPTVNSVARATLGDDISGLTGPASDATMDQRGHEYRNVSMGGMPTGAVSQDAADDYLLTHQPTTATVASAVPSGVVRAVQQAAADASPSRLSGTTNSLLGDAVAMFGSVGNIPANVMSAIRAQGAPQVPAVQDTRTADQLQLGDLYRRGGAVRRYSIGGDTGDDMTQGGGAAQTGNPYQDIGPTMAALLQQAQLSGDPQKLQQVQAAIKVLTTPAEPSGTSGAPQSGFGMPSAPGYARGGATQRPGMPARGSLGHSIGPGSNVPPNSFIVPADIPAALGRGNADVGSRALRAMGAVPIHGPGDGVSDSVMARSSGGPIALSAGEHAFSPGAVQRYGGHQALSSFVTGARNNEINRLKAMPKPVR